MYMEQLGPVCLIFFKGDLGHPKVHCSVCYQKFVLRISNSTYFIFIFRFIPDAEYSLGLGGDLEPTPGIAGQLDEFKNTLEDEMIKSDRFEKLLQAALNP